MILNKLFSDLPKFHTIEFKRGVNFIVGKRDNPDSLNIQNSYNGVGKSLTVELIHFCLASNSIKAFKEIGHYYCALEFESNGAIYVIKRFFDNDQEVYLNNKLKKLSEIKEFLNSCCFINDIPEYVSARSILSRFIRRYKKNYSKYDEQITSEQKQVSLVNNAYLLGLNTECVIKKIKNKEKYSMLNSTKKSLNSDEILVDYFKGKGNIDFKIKDLEDRKKQLSERIKSFNVVENYSEIKNEADVLSKECNRISNRISTLNYLIEKSSNFQSVNNDATDVAKMYEEMQISLPELVIKKVDEVNNFHQELIKYRNLSYARQKEKYIEEKHKLQADFDNKSALLMSKMDILKTSGALEEYNIMCQELAEINSNITKTVEYKKLMAKYEEEINLSKINKAQITIDNSNYLESIKVIQDEIMDKFRYYSRRFYNNKPSGLSIELNSKDNKLAFEINADIEGDSSDGINEVKVFCFDMTLLKLHHHDISFIFHDSRLLANMDPRQRITWFNIICDEFPDNGNDQYIVSINEDYILTMLEMGHQEHANKIKSFIDSHTRVTLTDKSPETKLLGMQINIQYDK